MLLYFTEKLYDVGYRLNLNRKWGKRDDWHPFDQYMSRQWYEEHTTNYSNYGQGFYAPFYIGMINIGTNRDKNQWRWSSTGRSMTKNSFGERDGWDGMAKVRKWNFKFDWKLIEWAKGANGKKLCGDCAFINIDAELKEINCASKLTIICEEL